MDILLDRVTSQAVSLAIRSGITITAGYAFKQCARVLREAPRGKAREELSHLQIRLESKIRILSPAIDLIELIAARGNTSLESAVGMTKHIRYEIQRLGTLLAEVADDRESSHHGKTRRKPDVQVESQVQFVIDEMRSVLAKMDDAVPLVNLAITTSGVNLSTKLSGTISPSRLLQASTFLTAADSAYSAQPDTRHQVGPTYTLSMYMLFTSHTSRAAGHSSTLQPMWKEVIHKAKVKLVRVPLEALYDLPNVTRPAQHAYDLIPADAKSLEFAYQMILVEDLGDGRVHAFEDGRHPESFEDVTHAGIRDLIPMHEISKIFYADTGKLLNVGSDGDVNNPVLLLRRDVHAEPPRRMLQRSQMSANRLFDDSPSAASTPNDSRNVRSTTSADGDQHEQSLQDPPWRLSLDLDPEWIAFEVYTGDSASDSGSDEGQTEAASWLSPVTEGSPEPDLTASLGKLELRSSAPDGGLNEEREGYDSSDTHSALETSPANRPPAAQITTSLSLLEMLIKLTALQQFRQESHLAIEDELLNFFLEDSATAGAGPDKDQRQRARRDAVRRVGFDPYDESPVKRRGEEYIAHARGHASPRPSLDADAVKALLRDRHLGQSKARRLHRGLDSALASPPSSSCPPSVRLSLGRSTPAHRGDGWEQLQSDDPAMRIGDTDVASSHTSGADN